MNFGGCCKKPGSDYKKVLASTPPKWLVSKRNKIKKRKIILSGNVLIEIDEGAKFLILKYIISGLATDKKNNRY